MPNLTKIILSKTDGLGDVLLCLPLAGWIKKQRPELKIAFLVAEYAMPIVSHADFVDEVILKNDFLQHKGAYAESDTTAIIMVRPDRQVVKKAHHLGIRIRIGTNRRWYHWLYANRLVNLTRKNSPYHEMMLNAALLKPLKIPLPPNKETLAEYYGLQNPKEVLPAHISHALYGGKHRVVIHPKSKGSAREWPLAYYLQFVEQLPAEEYVIFLTGTEAEGQQIVAQMPQLYRHPRIINCCGLLTLSQLMTLIAACDTLVACSTGPLHIAAAYGKRAIGLYPPLRPMHPGRWQPVGKGAICLARDVACKHCPLPTECACMQWITPTMVLEALNSPATAQR